MTKQTSLRKNAISLFLLINFGIAWAIFGFVAYLKSMYGQDPSILLVIALAMFAPAISAIIVKKFILKEGLRSYRFKLRPIEYSLIAWVLPVILALFALFLTLSMGFGKLDPSMQSFFSLLPKETIENMGTAPSFWSILIISMFLPVFINCFFTIGEELGWRGFLQDELKALGQKRSYLIIGLIWGIWHAPIILQGHNYPTNPILGVFWMIIYCVLLSYIFGWLKDKSGSILAPTIAHSSLNGPAMITYMVLKDTNILLGGILGVTGFISMGLFVGYLLITKQIN